MPRILDIVTFPPDAIAYRIDFSWDESSRPKMAGRVQTTLRLVCQRCLDDLDWRIDSRFEFVVTGDEHEETRGRDAVVGAGGKIVLESTIEDEILLALPNAPVHADGACEVPGAGKAASQWTEERSNPFSALGILRSRYGTDRPS